MRKQSERLYWGITRIDEDLLAEAEAERQAPPGRKRRTGRTLALAACLLLVVGAVLTVPRLGSHLHNPGTSDTPGWRAGAGSAGPVQTEDGVVIPPMEVSLRASGAEAADMIPCFIYQGRCYVQAESLPGGGDLVEERLGTATGLIDEWTPADGWVDLAGSVKGPFYRVKGMDPAFLLCMREPSGALDLYVNDNGITLKTGGDLIEERLHLPERYAGLEYQTWEDWYYDTGKMATLKPEYEAQARAFLDALQAGTFVVRTGRTGEEEWTALHHIRFQLDNGLRAHFSLFTDGTDGYVYYYGIGSVWLKVEREALESFVALLEKEDAGIPGQAENFALTLEDCRSDPALGAYLPAFLPETMDFQSGYIYYEVDPETAEVGPAERIHLELRDFTDAGGSYGALDVLPADQAEAFAPGFPLLEREELTLARVEELMSGADLDLIVSMRDAAAVLSVRDLGAEDCFALLDSLPRPGAA